MKPHGESGYILASALAVLLAISLVAAALVSTSTDGLRQVRRAEAEAAREVLLRSALLVVTSQLSLDPRRRQLRFDDGETTINVLGQPIRVRLGWEHAKLDVNHASREAIESALRDREADPGNLHNFLSAIERARAEGKSIRLLEDVLPVSANAECLHSILTVFGGQADYQPDQARAVSTFGRPAAGSRVSIVLRSGAEPARTIVATVLMTGDPSAPAMVLDWRRAETAEGEICHAGQT